MKRSITIYHSPDADDAFMFYGIVSGAISEPGYEFHSALKDIESLNHLAKRGELEATAISVHAYPYLHDRYAILQCGASMGGSNYGPRLVATKPFAINDGKSRVFAIPGTLTSAALAFQIFLREQDIKAELVAVHFDKVQDVVRQGEVDAGLLIHEGQITHEREGFVTIADLGVWWWQKTELPLPLGVNVVRKDLGADACRAVASVLSRSIDFGLKNRKAAIDYALQFGRGLTNADADEFIGMYVNENTIDLGERGKKSIQLFLEQGVRLGLIPRDFSIEYVTP